MKGHFVNFAGEMEMDVKNGILSGLFGSQDMARRNMHLPVHAEWTSPSNIALVKYWGKKEGQIPANPSLSMTLKKAVTRTNLATTPSGGGKAFLTVNGSADHPFVPKLGKLLHWIAGEIPFIREFSFDVQTSNTFPHSAGIASSASGISAFTLCMLTFLEQFTGNKIPEGEFFRVASFVSRIGSGSACRSVHGSFTVWGETHAFPGTSDLYAVPVRDRIHDHFRDLRDAILVISPEPKSLSSSKGHSLMNEHPFAAARFEQARRNLDEVLDALHSGDLEKLAFFTENEALTLHALIMSSRGGAILLEPGSLEVISRIQKARAGGMPVCFTIDAGPNIHLLYPSGEKKMVERFILDDLAGFCGDGGVLFDECGDGPAIWNTERHVP